MKTNTPDNAKTDLPDSDPTARHKYPYSAEEDIPNASPNIQGLQTSNKSGKHSSVEKAAASRPDMGAGRGAEQVSGAFGEDDSHTITGRNAQPGTNQFRCHGCGRYFSSPSELAEHEMECRTAKQATEQGRASLKAEDEGSGPERDDGSNEFSSRKAGGGSR